MAVFRIERTLDYTVMSNHHLKDTALSLKAKGLLSMMLSLPDEWNYTTRGLAAICKEGVDAIGGALRELEKAGYIVRRQLRGPGGRISDTEYTIYEKPCPGAEEPPEEPGPDTTPPDTGAPDTAFPYLVEPDMVEPSTEKPAELNTKRSNIQKSNTHLSNTHSFVLSTPELEGMKDVYEKREEIREQIEYDLICTPVNRTQVDEFVELMLEVAMTRSPTIKIGRDAEYPTAFVQQRFEQIERRILNASHDILSPVAPYIARPHPRLIGRLQRMTLGVVAIVRLLILIGNRIQVCRRGDQRRLQTVYLRYILGRERTEINRFFCRENPRGVRIHRNSVDRDIHDIVRHERLFGIRRIGDFVRIDVCSGNRLILAVRNRRCLQLPAAVVAIGGRGAERGNPILIILPIDGFQLRIFDIQPFVVQQIQRKLGDGDVFRRGGFIVVLLLIKFIRRCKLIGIIDLSCKFSSQCAFG